ncbi:MAG: hypothetical protein M1816_000150 [Peltula sp. TS41687]|nr:MAG: hypothetical protein M1816_000150 [Peltula sp. TS41687]
MTLVSTVPGEARMSLSPQEPSPPNMSSPQDQAAAPASDVTSPGTDERGRGRRRSRNVGRTDEDGDGGTRQSPQGDLSADDPPRKRRRSRKGLDKKFECNHPDCGKSYSRAEHLYRHQLNHNPKDIYYCKFENCPRYFVRQDLCQRHRERHTARVPPLQRGNVSGPGVPSQASGGPGARNNSLELSPISGRTDLSNTPGRDSTLTPVKSEIQSPFLSLARPEVAHRGREVGLTPIKTELAQSTHRTATDPRPASASTVKSASTIRSSTDALNSLSVFENSPVVPARTGTDAGANGGTLGLKRSNSDNTFRVDDHGMKNFDGSSAAPRSTPVSSMGDNRRQTSFGSMDSSRSGFSPQSNTPGFVRPSGQQTGMYAQPKPMMAAYSSLPAASQPCLGTINSGGPMAQSYGGPQGSFVAPQAFVPLSLPPPGHTTMSQANGSRASDGSFVTAGPVSLSSLQQHPGSSASTMQPLVSESVLFDTSTYTVPVFGEGGITRSPFHIPEDVVSWLFNDQQAGNPSALGQMGSLANWNVDNLGASFPPGYGQNDFPVDGFFSQTVAQPQHPMAVTSILDSGRGEFSLSEQKRQELLELIELRFHENDHAPVTKVKAELMDGDRNDDDHVLSLRSMQSYFWSFWTRFHPQLPILHQPTFIPDQQENLLLIAMLAIGASCLEKEHGQYATEEGAKLANFLAWHLRGEIFNHAHFRPPAKLWIFQALILLEIYEKMYSTRPLHEGAHIFHATTITLMRRGAALIGKFAAETPPSARDEKSTHGSNSSAQTPSGTVPDKWWHDWITGEAMRRVAFAAFVTDSLHATMFGHSAIMVAHEMQLPLPYDEALWSATSSAEVGRIESSLGAHGFKRPRFLEGLKAMLMGQKVRTNSFGRTILMAGLLSVSWHMNQRDLQVSALGVVQQLGGKDKWRSALTRAFDSWRQDFDAYLVENPEGYSGSYQYSGSQELRDGIVFESKNVLHHLAHMAMHVDIVDCQIFARSPRLLGRAIGPQDYNGAQRRMKEWASTARARDATYYALRFLSEVLMPTTDHFGHPAMHTPPLSDEYPGYSAREDYLMNRPWVLYFAALIVWSYGYALEGVITPSRRPPSTPAEKQQDMYDFLHRAGSVGSPEMLISVPGKNQCVGTLMVLRDTFQTTRWELLQEACGKLTNCINMLLGVSLG